MSRELVTKGQRIKYARLKRGLGQTELGELIGIGQSSISKLERNQMLETAAIARLARALRVPAAWLELDDDQEPDWASPEQEESVAHRMSLSQLETVPTITWEQMGMKNPEGLPRVFRLPIENTEMVPRVGPGAWVQFSSQLAPSARPGDGVLVRDRTGGLHFRVYRAGRPGCWEAHAENAVYAPLDSERDGLEVLAVLTAVEARWG